MFVISAISFGKHTLTPLYSIVNEGLDHQEIAKVGHFQQFSKHFRYQRSQVPFSYLHTHLLFNNLSINISLFCYLNALVVKNKLFAKL